MQSLNLRPASMADCEFMRSCAALAYEKYVPRIGKKPAPMTADFEQAVKDGSATIAILASEPVGYAITLRQDTSLFIENIAILPDQQGTGLGKALMNALEAEARLIGLSEIKLYTNAAMTENLDFYRKLGFEQTGRRVENGFDRVFFMKGLM